MKKLNIGIELYLYWKYNIEKINIKKIKLIVLFMYLKIFKFLLYGFWGWIWFKLNKLYCIEYLVEKDGSFLN